MIAASTFRIACCAALLLASKVGAEPAMPLPPAGMTLADAVRRALANNAEVLVERSQADAAAGRRLQAAGRFDWMLTAGTSYDKTITLLTGDAADQHQTEQVSVAYQAGLQRQMRSGPSWSLNVESNGGQYRRPRQDQLNWTRLNAALTVPLLRGRGGVSATTEEDVAQLNAVASRLVFREMVAQTLRDTMLAYWQYRIRSELEQVAVSSEQRSKKLLTSTEKLVDADQRPRADLVLLRADHADKLAALGAATLARQEARRALGRLMGLDASAIDALPEAAQGTPGVAWAPDDIAGATAALSDDALLQRPDVRLLAVRMQVQQRLAATVRDAARPQLDLQAGMVYTKASEGGSRFGFWTEPGRYQSGPSIYARLQYQFPLENSQARGAGQEAAALLDVLRLRQQDLSAAVTSALASALQTLASSAQQLKSAQEGLALYEQAVAQEITKQRNGFATLIDIVNVEARYVAARSTVLQLQQAYAQALARLRYETGTLLPAPDQDLDPDRLVLDFAGLSSLDPLLPRLRAAGLGPPARP